MKKILFFTAIAALLFLSSCNTTQTLPQANLSGPAQSYEMYLPEGFEIKTIDFDVEYTTNVSGGNGFYGGYGNNISSSTGGNAFIKVHAIETETGTDYLLIYANRQERPIPVQVIKFEKKPKKQVFQTFRKD